MTTFQKTVKYLAMGFACFLAVCIIGGIISAVGLFGGFLGGDAVTEDMKTYTVATDITSLEVKVNAADLQIKQGETFSVESNLKYLTVEDKNGVLTIKETRKIANTYTGAALTLYIPDGAVFEKINIVTGAGRFTAEFLSAGTVNLEFGAGEVKIDTLIAASYADIEGGAGEITISGGALRNLDMEMGVGKLNLTSALTGECEFDMGIGESDITVLGNKDDYKLDIEKRIGNITVDGTAVSNTKIQGSGNNSIEITGGIGAVALNFQKQ